MIIDLFAGGGGASTGIEMALGRSPDVAINHDKEALAMHKANHPDTLHLCQDVRDAIPLEVTGGHPVSLLWASPDCTHFSKAKGGKPKSQEIRELAWTVVKWAKAVRPALIVVENVEEFRTWGPLDEQGYPIKSEAGSTFKTWIDALRALSYTVDVRELRACDYGSPTIRKRLFVVARLNGRPIVWPKPTHGPMGAQPYRTAADCIDWSIPCPSIFVTSEEIYQQYGIRAIRPLAENTMDRIAKGLKRFVLDNPEPYIVEGTTPFISQQNNNSVGQAVTDPLSTITAHTNHHALITPFIQHVQHGSAINGTMPADEPLRTITAHPKGGGMALIAPFISKMRGQNVGDIPEAPLHTVSAQGQHHAIVAAFLAKHYGGVTGQIVDKPIGTVTSVDHHSLVSAFFVKYYGQGAGSSLNDPMHTITAQDRFGLVTVNIEGEPYQVVDIGMRMLTPRELFRCQGFPENYIIDPPEYPLSKTSQVAKCGNSVPPQFAEALIRANYADQSALRKAG